VPDKTELDGFLLAHDIFDLAGGGGFETLAPPRVPGTNDLMDEDLDRPEDPNFANVMWDFEAEALFAFDPDTGDNLTQISPFNLSVYYDPDFQELLYWDGIAEEFVPLSFGGVFGFDEIVFLTPPRAVNPDEESSPIIIERRDIDDVPLDIGTVTAYLYSTDPDMVFMFEGNPVTSVDFLNGESQVTFTFITPNAGNPVITPSFEVLA